MKKILIPLIMLVSVCTFTSAKSIWENNFFGVGYSYMNRDNYVDHNIDLVATIYGVYIDGAIGTSLKDYGYRNDKRSCTVNFGYLFPIVVTEDVKIIAGPIAGYTNIAWHDGDYIYRDWYGYYREPTYRTCDEYFNYGGVMQVSIGDVGISFKASRNNYGIGIGYSF